MLLQVTNINKRKRLYEVTSDAGEVMVVNAGQILSALLSGNQFVNVHLTKKGFATVIGASTCYEQFNLDKQTQLQILNIIEAEKRQKEFEKQQMEEAIKQQKKQANRVKINGSRVNDKAIIYKGMRYMSVEALCKKHGKNSPEEFKRLYNIGYSLDECLGLQPLRPENQITPRSKTDRILDAMDVTRENKANNNSSSTGVTLESIGSTGYAQ